MDFVAVVREDGALAVPHALVGKGPLVTGQSVVVHVDDTPCPADFRERIAEARAIVRKYIPADVSLTEELFQMRRAEGENQHGEHSYP